MAALAARQQSLHRSTTEGIKNILSSLEEGAWNGRSKNVSIAFRKTTNTIFRNWLLGENSSINAPSDMKDDTDPSKPPFFALWAFGRHFPSVFKLSAYIPMWILERCVPLAANQRQVETHLRRLVKRHCPSSEPVQGLFFDLLRTNPRLRENNLQPAVDDFIATYWGPREVVGHTLTNIAYYLGKNPQWRQRLRDELHAVEYDILKALPHELRKLPILGAVCKEGMRLQRAGGVRIVRYSTDPVRYGDLLIPAGVSLDWLTISLAYTQH